MWSEDTGDVILSLHPFSLFPTSLENSVHSQKSKQCAGRTDKSFVLQRVLWWLHRSRQTWYLDVFLFFFFRLSSARRLPHSSCVCLGLDSDSSDVCKPWSIQDPDSLCFHISVNFDMWLRVVNVMYGSNGTWWGRLCWANNHCSKQLDRTLVVCSDFFCLC